MTFQPKVLSDIIDEMIAYISSNTDITDFEIGSVARTFVEAAAIQDDEQYFQLVQLLDDFSISKAFGTDLDQRVLDAGLVRITPRAATGTIYYTNEALKKTTVNTNAATAATSLVVVSATKLPSAASLPYTIRIGEGTTGVEDVTVSAIATNTLTITALVNDHLVGERVAYVDASSNISINSGIQTKTISTNGDPVVTFTSTTAAILVNGNYYSTKARAKATTFGKEGNVTKGAIKTFTSSVPFAGAGVTNLFSFSGGRSSETDAELKDRYRNKIQSLSAGTPLTLQQAVLGVRDVVTGQTVVTSSLREDFANNEVIVYIDDGTGFTPDKAMLASNFFRTTVGSGQTTVTLLSASGAANFPTTGYILLSPESNSQREIKAFTGVNYTTNVITLSGTTANGHDANDEVVLVDYIEQLNIEAGRKYFKLKNFPVVRNSLRVWFGSSGASFSLKTEGTDFIINKATGNLEVLGAGLGLNGSIIATYSYYTGLVATAQKVLNGDPTDQVNFPGVVAAGVKTVVETPSIRRINVKVVITPIDGASKSDIIPVAIQSIENYILSLGIGGDVVKAEIATRVMEINGVYDCDVQLPANNITIFEDEISYPFDSDGNTLVIVS